MFGVFTMHPALYWVGGVAIAGFGAFSYFEDIESEKAKAEALASKPPAQVSLAQFDPAVNAGPADEVVVVGQVDLEAQYVLTRERKSVETKRWMAPLYEPEATEKPSPVKYILFETDGSVSNEYLQNAVVAFDGERPVLEINGELASPSSGFKDMIIEALGEQNLTLADDPIYIDPYQEGRTAALQPSESGKETAYFIGGAGGVVFLYGFLRMFMRRRS